MTNTAQEQVACKSLPTTRVYIRIGGGSWVEIGKTYQDLAQNISLFLSSSLNLLLLSVVEV